MSVTIVKDKKGPCFFLSHKRCGITEGIWLSPSEMDELGRILRERDVHYG